MVFLNSGRSARTTRFRSGSRRQPLPNPPQPAARPPRRRPTIHAVGPPRSRLWRDIRRTRNHRGYSPGIRPRRPGASPLEVPCLLGCSALRPERPTERARCVWASSDFPSREFRSRARVYRRSRRSWPVNDRPTPREDVKKPTRFMEFALGCPPNFRCDPVLRNRHAEVQHSN